MDGPPQPCHLRSKSRSSSAPHSMSADAHGSCGGGSSNSRSSREKSAKQPARRVGGTSWVTSIAGTTPGIQSHRPSGTLPYLPATVASDGLYMSARSMRGPRADSIEFGKHNQNCPVNLANSSGSAQEMGCPSRARRAKGRIRLNFSPVPAGGTTPVGCLCRP